MRITESKFFSKYYNGDTFSANTSDYSLNSVGVVQEQKMLSQIIEIDVASYANFGANFDVQSSRITRLAGSFIGDGFSIGDEFTASYTPPGGSNIQFTAVITAITSQRIDFTNKVDTVGTYADSNTDNFRLYLLSPLYGFKMNYNFIENSDPVVFNNFIDGSTMGWYADNVGSGVTRSTSFVVATQLGANKSWYNGSLKVRYIDNVGHIQRFELNHEFTILPFYQDSELTNLQTNTPPISFFGGASLKYISKLDFRRVLSDPNSSKVVDYDNIQGSIGWFNEPFNGFSMPFSVSNLGYLDSLGSIVSKISVGDITTINYTINSSLSSFSTSTKVGLNVSFLPDLAEYQRSTNDFRENFLFDTVYGIADGSTNSVVSAKQIQEYTLTRVNANEITVQLKVLFIDSRLTNVSNYIISAEVSSDAGSNTVNDKTNLLVTVDSFGKSTDVKDLWNVDDLNFELYQDAKGTKNYTNFNGWVEDSLNISFTSWLDTSKNAFLNDLSVNIVAYNPTTNDSFIIHETIVPLSGVVVGGTQQFNTDQVAGFNFLTKNDYNIIKFTNSSTVGTKEYYEGVVSVKLDWQKWRSLATANTIFYDTTKLNNGLNHNSSNYSLANGYEIRVNIVANVNETVSGVNTIYTTANIGSKVYDYDKDGNATSVWSGNINTFNSAGVNLVGSLLTSGITTLKAIYNTTGVLGVVGDYFVWFGIDAVNSTSKNSIKLYNATLSISGTDLIAEYQLPSSEVTTGINYNLSSRLKCIPDIGCAETLSFSSVIGTGSNVNWDIFTSVAISGTAKVVVKQSDGTIRETLTGLVGDGFSTFTSDFSNTVISITNYLGGDVEDAENLDFYRTSYKNAMIWWGSNSEDSIVLEFTLDCVTEQIKIYTI
tara:strand:+ start:2976 stop:5618 length:2643 start_codon:yes stop_codon:yes gene_type:complete